MIDHKAHTRNAFKIIFQGTGSWNDAKNKSIYPVNKYGLIISKIWRGIKDIAEPIKTVLIVIIIGVTLFLKKVDNIKHKLLIVIITIVEIINARKNLQIISPSERNNNPRWNTAKSTTPKNKELIKRV